MKATQDNWLDDSDVYEMRVRVNEGETRAALAEEFGVCTRTVTDIVSGTRFGYVGGPTTPPERTRALSPAEVGEIRRRADEGESEADLAREFCLLLGVVNSLCRGDTYKGLEGPIRATLEQGRRLSEEEVIEIRQAACELGLTAFEIEDQFGVARQSVYAIVRGSIYVDYAGPRFEGDWPKRRSSKHQLDDEKVLTIRAMAYNGVPFSDIARETYVNSSVIADVAYGRSYQWVGGYVLTEEKDRRGRLNAGHVEDIRARAARGESDAELGLEYDMPAKAIGRIRLGQTYKRDGGPRTRRQAPRRVK